MLQAGKQSAVLVGSYDGHFYVLPIFGKSALRAKVRSARSLWVWLALVAGVFLFVVLPICLLMGPVERSKEQQ